MEISFDKKQLSQLVKIAHIGHWIINAWQEEPDADIEEFIQYLYTQAHDKGITDDLEFDAESKTYSMSSTAEGEIENLVDKYNNEIFWAELISRLGSRDFLNKYDEKTIDAMPRDEQYNRLQEEILKYEEEFKESGLNKLAVMKG